MRKIPIHLKDSSGGLNNTVNAAKIKPNEMAILENYHTDEGSYLKKRKGCVMAQSAPIYPTLFDANGVDAQTLALYHLDEASGNAIDSSGNSYNLTAIGDTISSDIGLLPLTSPIGRRFKSTMLAGLFSNSGVVTGIFDGKYITLEGFIKIASNSKVQSFPPVLFGSINNCPHTVQGSGNMISLGQTAAGKPYAIFSLNLCKSGQTLTFALGEGIYKGSTVLNSRYLPSEKWLHVRGTFNSDTGYMTLYINGEIHSQVNVGKNMLIVDSLPAASDWTSGLTIGTGCLPDVYNGSTVRASIIPDVVIDEVRFSNIERADWPFQLPRGLGREFAKSDGTRQWIQPAGDGLYYNVGDGNWKLIGSGYSTTADWDLCQVRDIMYMSNGTDHPLAWNGSSLKPMGPPPILPLVYETASGTLAAGIYKYCYTVRYGDYETGPSPIASITTTGKSVAVDNLFTRHSNATSIKVYRTKTGGSTFYLDREIINDITVDHLSMIGAYGAGGSPGTPSTDSGSDDLADASLGTGAYIVMTASIANSIIPYGRFMLAENNVMFMCGMIGEPYYLRWSQLQNPDCWQATDFTMASANSGPLVGMGSYYGQVVVSKDGRDSLILRGTDPSSWAQMENLYPVGAIDHWSFVRRYRDESGLYTLCWQGPDGHIYQYDGQNVSRISSNIKGTISGLAQSNASRMEWDTVTESDWLSQENAGGSASINVRADHYETDGVRENLGSSEIVNVMNYLPLAGHQGNALPGDILCMCKGTAEEEFYFSCKPAFVYTDLVPTSTAFPVIYHTLDNFQTWSVFYTHTENSMYIVELVFANDSDTGNRDWLMFFTSTISVLLNGGAGILFGEESGYVWRVINGDPTAIRFNGGPFYWRADIGENFTVSDAVEVGNVLHGVFGNCNADGINGVFTGDISPKNLYLTHNQSIYVTSGGVWYFGFSPTGIRVQTGMTGLTDPPSIGQQNIATPGWSAMIPAGFCSLILYSSFPPNFTFYFVHRITATWLGGAFRPQAFWSHGKLWFVRAQAENSFGWSSSAVLRIDFTANTATTVMGGDYSAIAITHDNGNLYAINTGSLGGVNGTGYCNLYSYDMVSCVQKHLYDLITAMNYNNLIPTRLAWVNSANPNEPYGRLGVIGEYFDFADGQRDTYTKHGFIGDWSLLNGFEWLTNTTIRPGANSVFFLTNFPQEITGHNTAETLYVALQGYASDPLWQINAPGYQGVVSVLDGDIPNNGNGIISNLLFVATSAAAGNYLWPDRIYFMTDAVVSSDRRLMQLGVVGNNLGVAVPWTLRGYFYSKVNNLGVFTSFDALESPFQGDVTFGLRNALEYDSQNFPLFDNVTEQSVVPNTKVLIPGYPAGPYTQWLLHFTWVYGQLQPSVKFVSLGYFLGQSNIPRVVVIHWDGRTIWFVSEMGDTENTLALVFQRNDTWTVYRGLNMKGVGRFRNQIVGIKGFEFVQLYQGNDDLGVIIQGLARTGLMMEDSTLKSIRMTSAETKTFINSDNPTGNGYALITPYKGEMPMAVAFRCPFQAATVEETRYCHCPPNSADGTLALIYAQNFAVQIETSPETGAFAPYYSQPEEIEAIHLNAFVTTPRHSAER